MSKSLELAVEKRSITGKKVSQLYRSGYVVGNIFSKGKESTSIQVAYEPMRKMVEAAGYNHPIELSIDGGSAHLVMIKEIDRDPKKHMIRHIGFHEVRKDQKIEAEVPVELVGTSPAVLAGNIILRGDDTILVEASPLDMPDHLEADATMLVNEDDSILVRDLKLPPNVVLADDGDKMVFKVEVPRSQIEEEVVTEADAVAATLANSGEQKPAETKE